MSRPAALRGCPCTVCLPQGCGPGMPGPYAKSLPLTREVRLSKKVCSPLGPLCEGAPPAGGGGENCTAARNISGYGKVLSLRPFGAPPSQREVFRQAGPPFDKGGFFFLAHFSIFFCAFGTFFDYFAQIGCFCGSYYTIMIKYRRMYIFTARLLRL